MKQIRSALVAALLLAAFCLLIPPARAVYPDAAEIEHTEAVDSLTALGLFAGYDDGTFRPDAVITRAQMCKLICLAFTGGAAPAPGTGAPSPFRDTGGHWADLFITYCYTLGVVSGDAGAGGPFRPDDTVTAAEAAKMTLTALGYDAALSGFTGNDWAFRVVMAAGQKNLFAGLSGLSPGDGLARDDAAQMLCNALEAAMVTYTYSLATVDGELVSIPHTVDTSDTILRKNFGAAKYEGVVTANECATAVGGASTLLDPGLTGLDTDGDRDIDLTFQTATGTELLGRRVAVYAKAYENGVFRTVYGAPVVLSSNIAATYTAAFNSPGALEEALHASGIASLDAAVVTNTVFSGTISSFSALHARMGNGIEVTAVCSGAGDGAADYILVTQKSVGTVIGHSAAGAGLLAVKNTSTGSLDIAGLPFADVTGADSVSAGDVVLYYAVGSRWVVEKAAFAVITPDSISGFWVGAGGKTYEASTLVSAYNSGGTSSLSAAVSFGTAYSLYFDDAGYVVYVAAAGPAARHLMFLAVGNYSPLYDTLPAKVLLDDGSEQIVEIESLAAAGTTVSVAGNGSAVETALKSTLLTALDAAASSPKIYSYTLASDGSYRVTQLPTGFSTTQVVAKYPALLTSGTVANAETRFVLDDNGTFRIYSGIAAVPTVNTSGDAAYCFTYETGGAAAVVFLKGAVSGTGNNDIFVLHALPTVMLENGLTVYRYSVVLNGATVEIEVTGAAKDAAFSRTGLVTNVSLTLDGAWQIDAQIAPAAAAPAVQLGGGVIRGPVMQTASGSTAWSTEYLSAGSSVKVYLVDGESVAPGSLDDIVALASYPTLSSNILIVRAALLPGSPDYYVAGSIYLVQ